MPFSPAEIALALFTFFNVARLLAYLPQIVRIGRDRGGAEAVSCSSWGLFGASNLSTVAYALLVVEDWGMAAVFAVNAVCCFAICVLTVWKRLQHANPARTLAAPRHTGCAAPWQQPPTRDRSSISAAFPAGAHHRRAA